jgi:hypothetical protein
MSALRPQLVETYPTRDAWLAARGGTDRTRIGASEVPAILDVDGSFGTPWDVWARKTGALEQRPDTAAEAKVKARGQRWESVVLAEYADHTGRDALTPGDVVGQPGALVIVRHAVEAWAVCSPDAFTLDPLVGDGAVEAKTDVAGEWARADLTLERAADYTPEIAPAAKLVQCYWQLETTGLAFVDLVCLLPRYEVRVVRVLRDAGHQAELLDQVGAWRERHLVRGEAPEIDASETCGRWLAKRFPGAGKEVREATAEEAALLRELANVKAARKQCEATEETLGNQLHALLGDTYGVRLATGAKALLIPMKGRQTAKLADLEKQRPDLFAQLVAGGFIGRGEDCRQLRLTGF